MDASQYAELFLTESREHLTAINQHLLELERSGGGEESVSAIFRGVHTVKGMSATMGYTVVAELSHELETLLDRVRRREQAITADLMDVLFRAVDVLEAAIEGAVKGDEGSVSTAAVLARLRAIGRGQSGAETAVAGEGATADDATAHSPTAPTVEPPNIAHWTIEPPAGAGTLVRIRLADETPLRGVRAFLVVQALRRLGDATIVSPPLAALQAEQFEHDFALRLVTSHPLEEVERVARGAGDVVGVQVGEDLAGATMGASRADAADERAGGPENAGEEGATGPGDARAIDVAAAGSSGGVSRQARHVRIDLRRLDALMNLIGELVITRGRLQQLAGGIGDAALGESVQQASRLIGDLRDEIMTSRMVPVWQVFDRFPRLVRDASRALGKRIEFSIEGKDIELDRSMLDEIGEPIVHLLRNAIDHGIEMPEERVRAGKPPSGKLYLSALRDRSAVVVRVSDDGRGIDRQRVLAKAKASGLADVAKTELSDEELLRMIARPGFSTAEKVSDLSGRGVGIDAVYTRVRALGGAVDIRSTHGQGTTVTLRLPLTLAIMRALLARVDDETYAIPLTHVSETVELAPGQLKALQGREVLVLRDDVLPVLRLRKLVGLAGIATPGNGRREQVVVIDLPDRRAGLVVDELTGQQEIVVKQFDGVQQSGTLFGGATILGDGAPALIVDVSSLP